MFTMMKMVNSANLEPATQVGRSGRNTIEVHHDAKRPASLYNQEFKKSTEYAQLGSSSRVCDHGVAFFHPGSDHNDAFLT